MCGPSAEEKSLAQQQASFSTVLQSNYNTQFANQAAILKSLNARLAPIVAAGPNQRGFSSEELAARRSQALNATGANYANAARALGGQLAGRGGDSGLVSGVDKQIKASLASEAAKAVSDQQLQITADDYAAGRDQFNRATAGQMALAGEYNPLGYAGQGTQANQSAFQEADRIQQQQGAKWKAIAGGITGLAGAFIPGGGLKALSGTFGAKD